MAKSHHWKAANPPRHPKLNLLPDTAFLIYLESPQAPFVQASEMSYSFQTLMAHTQLGGEEGTGQTPRPPPRPPRCLPLRGPPHGTPHSAGAPCSPEQPRPSRRTPVSPCGPFPFHCQPSGLRGLPQSRHCLPCSGRPANSGGCLRFHLMKLW